MTNLGIRALLLLMPLGCFAGNLHCEDFHGVACYDGCPESKAGLKWAEDQDIRDPYACVGHSLEFDQACATYVYERGAAPAAPETSTSSISLQRTDGTETRDDRGE
jgi:hypothetical protein